jgi:hypothetical protein
MTDCSSAASKSSAASTVWALGLSPSRRPHIYIMSFLGLARQGKGRERFWIGDAPLSAVRRAPPPPSPPRRPSAPRMRIERCSGSRFAEISSSFGSCNPEPDQLRQSAIKRLLWEPQFAIKAARLKRSAVRLQPAFGLDFRRSSNPSRFRSPTWRRPPL